MGDRCGWRARILGTLWLGIEEGLQIGCGQGWPTVTLKDGKQTVGDTGDVKLSLRDDSHLVGTAKMAQIAGVSDQTLYNWEREGKLAEAGIVTRHGNERRWDFERLLAWRDTHKPVDGQIHGGKRENAGRKSGAPVPGRQATERRESPAVGKHGPTAGNSAEERKNQPPSPATTSPAVAGRPEYDDDEEDDDGTLFDAREREIADQMEAELGGDLAGTLTVARSGKISSSMALTAVKLQEAKRKMIDNRERLGELVDAKQVATVMMQALQKVREPLDSFPDRVSTELAAKMGLSPAQMADVRELARTEVHRMCALLRDALTE